MDLKGVLDQYIAGQATAADVAAMVSRGKHERSLHDINAAIELGYDSYDDDPNTYAVIFGAKLAGTLSDEQVAEIDAALKGS